ncbi:hypothetical protein ACQCWD_20765 [Bacillus thuringiensis]|uniref:Short-chain dehydrogenase n=1 Tax=Bacillus cereus TaxID=1396 RepID=A0AAN5XL35_BACCE|nr:MULTISPECIES: short-chain dehydrogenase [Bacillus cereus group]KAB2364179.1 short-chain dehydrogenase [Bacillus thuringiensis]KAB2447031.1 short-chain dehydrogenase [Bacillus cereus]KAB2486405.1 short-chain dehydrogenase [Bacillus cereus]
MNNFNIESLFLSTSLYKELDFPKNHLEIFPVFFLRSVDTLQFDSFCIKCEKSSTFKCSHTHVRNPNYADYASAHNRGYREDFWEIFSAQLEFSCQRNQEHKYSITLNSPGNLKLIKSGQYPSFASIEQHNIKKYRKIIQRDYKDFSTAIGLNSHGVGIGSFVYLRRIFENLVEEKHRLAQTIPNWDEELYNRSRMNEKIDLLKNFLPSILVENKQLYGIISKGIHELSEEECLDMFPQVKLAIELILDEKLYKLDEEKKIASIKSFTQSKHAELSAR